VYEGAFTLSIDQSAIAIDPGRRARYGRVVKTCWASHVALLLVTTLLSVATLVLGGCATTGPSPDEVLHSRYPPERPFAESRFATFAGVTLHYRAWTPEGPPTAKLLLLHAAGGSTVTYRLLAPRLAEAGYAVVAVDLPGFGFSDQALGFEHAADNRSGLLWTFVDRIDTEPNEFPAAPGWIVGGHGMGGRVATAMALERPARTEGLLLFAAEVAGVQRPGRGFALPPVRWAWRAWLTNSLYTVDGVRELLGEAYGRRPTDEEVGLYAAPLLRPDMPEAYVRYARTAGEMDFDLESISTSALLVWGAADTWIEPEEAQRAAARLPNARLVTVPGAAHLPMETHVDAVLEAFARWAGRL
jgi:pimeloyl-ACP methyl ester carboxylesterase